MKLIERASRSARRGLAIALTDIRVDGWRLCHARGNASAVISAADLDLMALDDRRRDAIVESFAMLCRALDFSLQVVVQVRRIQPTWAGPADGRAAADGAVAELESAMRDHWQYQLTRKPSFSRTVLFVPTCPGGAGQSLERAVGLVVESARRVGIPARLLRGEALERCLAGHFPAGAPGSGGSSWSESAGHARLGGTFLSGYVMRRLPGSPVLPGWLAMLLTVPTECDVALHLMPAGVTEAVSSLGRRLRGLSAQRLLDLDRGLVGDAWNDVAIDNAVSLRDRLARNSSRPLRLALCAVARADDVATLRHARHEVQAAFRGTLCQVDPARFRQLDLALTAAPLGLNLVNEAKLVDSRSAASCVPWSRSSLDDGVGYRLGVLREGEAPVRLDPFDSELHANANIAIIAASGHGKSFAIGTLVLEALTVGTTSVIVDPEEEYRGLIGAVGGDYISLAPGAGTAINVFELIQPRSRPAEAALSAVIGETTQIVVDLVQILCGGRLGEAERAHVDLAARAAQQRAAACGRTPVLGDCIEGLEGPEPAVAVVLRRVCSGPLGDLFNRPTSIRLGASVTGVSFRDLSGEFVGAATLMVAQWLWGLVRDRRRRHHLIFDEAGILGQHPPLRALLVQLARRCRKYGASLVVATQNAQDLLQTDEGLVVATNCAMVLLGGHRAAETARMEQAFGLTEAQRRFLESAVRGEFLLIAGNRRAQFQVRVPELHQQLLSQPGAGARPQLRPPASPDRCPRDAAPPLP